MLGKQDTQTSILDLESWLPSPLVDPNSIYGIMAQWGNRLIQDSDFTNLYSHTGRPSDSPALLSKALLLMYHDNVSDREAEERAKFDLRWKVALRLSLDEAGFDHTALCRFRSRLLINDKQKFIFERFINLAKEAGIIKENGLQIIDSTHVDYTQKDKEDIDWNDPSARQELLNKLVKDSRNITETLKDIELSMKEQSALELLSAITEQDIEEKDGRAALKKGVAKDRIISVEDPEMRHGHKTSQGKFNGHKVQEYSDLAGNERRLCIFFLPSRPALNNLVTPEMIEIDCHVPDADSMTAYKVLKAVHKALHEKMVNGKQILSAGQLGELSTAPGYFCAGMRFKYHGTIS